MPRKKNKKLSGLTPVKPGMDNKNTGMVQDMNLSITELKNDVLLSIRVKKNKLPTVVKSLARLSETINSGHDDIQETEENGIESLISYDDPKPVFWIDDTKYLTAREIEIMERLSLGRFNKEIATDLGLQECTVKNNLQRIFRKFGVNNRSEAILEYMKCKRSNKKVS